MASSLVSGGIFPPVPTFFADDGELDLATLQQHIHWLAEFPLAGLLVLGSNGEAMHLTEAERVAVITAARVALAAMAPAWPLLAGTADLSTRGTIARCRSAADAGADVAVVLPPFAFPAQMTTAAIAAHFYAVADTSPIPVIIYNMPANAGNIDLSADLIITLAQHERIIGVKDSSGNVAKLAQIVANTKPHFAVLAGSGSFLLPTLCVGGTGAIAAVANVIPAHTAAIYHLWQERFAAESFIAAQQRESHARTLQAALIPLNQLVTTTYGVAGLKAALAFVRGYGGQPRGPLLPLDAGGIAALQSCYLALNKTNLL